MEAASFNLRHLRAYQAVLHCGSITAGSERVHMSQPTMTQAIAKLERRVGTGLFHRHRSGMTATRAGALFGARVDRALAALEEGPEPAGQPDQAYPIYSYDHDAPGPEAVILGDVAGPGEKMIDGRTDAC